MDYCQQNKNSLYRSTFETKQVKQNALSSANVLEPMLLTKLAYVYLSQLANTVEMKPEKQTDINGNFNDIPGLLIFTRLLILVLMLIASTQKNNNNKKNPHSYSVSMHH